MASEHELGIRFTSEGSAEVERQIEGIADQVDDLNKGEVEIDVTADTREAETRIERFEREVDGLTDDARELRVEFRSSQINKEIKKSLRQLEKLEDPVDIEVATADLERAQKDLRDLEELAERKYEIEIDADPKRTAQRASGDLSAMDSAALSSADRFQSLGGSVRGVTDELGLASSGVNSFAVGALDAGDVAVQMGEKFGLSASAAASLGTALGVAGIGAVIAGTAIPAIMSLTSSQEELNEETKAATDRINEQLGLLESFDEFAGQTGLVAEALFGDLDDEQLTKFSRFTESLGTTIPDVLQKLEAAGGDFAPVLKDLFQDDVLAGRIKEIGDQFGVTGDEIADAAARADDWNEFTKDLDLSIDDELSATGNALRSLFNEIELGQDIVDEIDLAKGFSDAALQIQQGALGQAAAEQFATIKASMPDADDAAVVKAFFDKVNADTEAAGRIAAREADKLNAARAEGMYLAEQFEGQVIPAIGGVNTILQGMEDIDGPELMVTATLAEMDRLTDGLEGTVNGLKFDKKIDRLFQNAVDSAVKADQQIAANGFDGAEAAIRDSEIALGDLRLAIANYVTDLDGIDPEVKTDIIADLDEASAAEVIRLYEQLKAGVVVPVSIQRLNNINWGDIGPYPISADPDGTRAMSMDSPVTATSPFRTRPVAIGPRTVQNITVNVPNGLNLRNVSDTLSRWQRVNGGRL